MTARSGERRRVAVGAARIDVLAAACAVQVVLDLARDRSTTSLVVTPNIDHLVRLEKDRDFRRAYNQADLVLADGWPVALAARLRGGGSVPRIAGADLAPIVAAQALAAGLTVALVGGAPGSAMGAATRLRADPRALAGRVVVEPAPRSQLESSHGLAELRANLREADAAVVLLGLGAPRQELLANDQLRDVGVGVILCVGAALDFMAGTKSRAPRWLQRLGLEWAHRAFSEPARLLPRYASAAPRFLLVVLGPRRAYDPSESLPARD